MNFILRDNRCRCMEAMATDLRIISSLVSKYENDEGLMFCPPKNRVQHSKSLFPYGLHSCINSVTSKDRHAANARSAKSLASTHNPTDLMHVNCMLRKYEHKS